MDVRGADAQPACYLIDTSRGPAQLTIHPCRGAQPARSLAVLLHGAGTDTSSTPLPLLADALAERGVTAIRLDQPYRVAGRKAPDPAKLLDAVLLELIPTIRKHAEPEAALGFVGRSSGARVACRTARAAGAVAVACLGFPLRPPAKFPKGNVRQDNAPQGDAPQGDRRRRNVLAPSADRSGELRGAGVPVLVVQGERDPFGMPARIRGVRVRRIPGVAHSPTPAMAHIAARWLTGQLQRN